MGRTAKPTRKVKVLKPTYAPPFADMLTERTHRYELLIFELLESDLNLSWIKSKETMSKQIKKETRAKHDRLRVLYMQTLKGAEVFSTIEYYRFYKKVAVEFFRNLSKNRRNVSTPQFMKTNAIVVRNEMQLLNAYPVSSWLEYAFAELTYLVLDAPQVFKKASFCAGCKKVFFARVSKAKHCSSRCRDQAYNRSQVESGENRRRLKNQRLNGVSYRY